MTIFGCLHKKRVLNYQLNDSFNEMIVFCTWQNPMVDRTEWSGGDTFTTKNIWTTI
jgi:hypothetical protein